MEENEGTIVYETVPIHDFAKYLQGCVSVLDEEWGRSASSRLAMLEKSNNKLPYSMAFLERNCVDDTVEVIGHSRLCKVHQQPKAGFVESVVIRKDRRGRGLGRKIMDETEKHANKLGLTVLYLNTYDKQRFYEHLGYEICQPVLSFGSASNILSEQQLAKLVDGLGLNVHSMSEADTKKVLSEVKADECCVPPGATKCNPTTSTPCRAPPPAPPLPCNQPSGKCTRVEKVTCSWMKKVLVE